MSSPSRRLVLDAAAPSRKDPIEVTSGGGSGAVDLIVSDNNGATSVRPGMAPPSMSQQSSESFLPQRSQLGCHLLKSAEGHCSHGTVKEGQTLP